MQRFMVLAYLASPANQEEWIYIHHFQLNGREAEEIPQEPKNILQGFLGHPFDLRHRRISARLLALGSI